LLPGQCSRFHLCPAPLQFWAELRRYNVVRVGIACLIGSWLMLQAPDTLGGLFGFPDWTLRFVAAR